MAEKEHFLFLQRQERFCTCLHSNNTMTPSCKHKPTHTIHLQTKTIPNLSITLSLFTSSSLHPLLHNGQLYLSSILFIHTLVPQVYLRPICLHPLLSTPPKHVVVSVPVWQISIVPNTVCQRNGNRAVARMH